MTRWFGHLPIHRKLVVLAITIAGCVLGLALVAQLVADLVRFRAAAAEDTRSLALVIAENTAAAAAFEDPGDARGMLTSLRLRSAIRRACVYLADGRLLAEFAASPDHACPPRPSPETGWGLVSAVVPIRRGEQLEGQVVLERGLDDLRGRALLTIAIGLLTMIGAGLVALPLANRLQRSISRPIVELAAAVRRTEVRGEMALPPSKTPHDEVGELAAAFEAMLARLREANATLHASNEALQLEVDERRRVEIEREALLVREREASRLKDEFLAAVSHELRTPLNAIVGWAQILERTSLDRDRLARAVASIARNAAAQTRLVEDLIDISRLSTGKLRLAMRPVDLGAVVEAAAEAVRPMAANRSVALTIDRPSTPCHVEGDPERLQQVVWNLLSNAIKFTEAGGAATVALAIEGGDAVIRVSDTGIGMAAPFVPHAFERFRQADGTLTREHGGLGLGLAIVRELTELHGGSVSAASEGPGRGSTFTVRLPHAPALRPASAASAEPPLPSLAGLHVLAVDDNDDALDVVVDVLAGAGARVTVARSGAEAVACWTSIAADVLVCDLAMPGMDGFTVLERIRAIDAAAGRLTPALAVSAHASDDLRARSLRAGFLAHLVKPYARAELVGAVAAIGEKV